MDTQCDYLVLGIPKDPDGDDIESDCELCKGPISHGIWTWNRGPIRVSLEQAVEGSMVPYIDAGVSEHNVGEHASNARTAMWCVTDDVLMEVKGIIHLRDIPPNGTWLSSPTECMASIQRLRCAGLACIALPELNRMVIEQKNDDGLLHLTRQFLANADTVSWAVKLFGAFSCDAMLAPVLHEILRSSWLKERKSTLDANNELKCGWAQEFYDYKRVPRNAVGSLLFTCLGDCGSEDKCDGRRLTITHRILSEMRLSGYTPWSAVRAVRMYERDISSTACKHCKAGLLASCAFLIECAAVEASRAHDWLVRNEAVIQLCWIMYNVHINTEAVSSDADDDDDDDDDNLKHWAKSTSAHSVKYQSYRSKEHRDVEPLVILFANDHPPLTKDAAVDMSQQGDGLTNRPPAIKECVTLGNLQDYNLPIDLETALRTNAQYSAGDSFVGPADKVEADAFDDIPIAVHTVQSIPSGTKDVRPQDPEDVTAAILLCFPRVAEAAVSQLSFEPPTRHASKLWPVFVNSTRACYQLFRALDIPVSPNPTYLLELLARGWEGIPLRILNRFLPMTGGPRWQIEQRHYDEYFLGPLNNLLSCGVIKESDRQQIVEALHRGIVPCFTGRGDSSCDRLLNSTLTLSFVACGITALSQSPAAAGAVGLALDAVSVTSAGLLYFAAWYLMVYLSAIYSHRTLGLKLSTSGSEADKCLCKALRISEDNGSVEEYRGHAIAQALRLVFKDMLSDHMLLRLVQLYVPEMLAQLPYVKQTDMVPGNVSAVMGARDLWLDTNRVRIGRRENGRLGFEYVGPIAHGLYSSIEGTLSPHVTRPVAKALFDITAADFDLWCDSLYEYSQHRDVESFSHIELEGNGDTYRDDTLGPSIIANELLNPTAPVVSVESNVSGSHVSASSVQADETADSDSSLGTLTRAIANLSVSHDRCVCSGLMIDTPQNIGLIGDGFLLSTSDVGAYAFSDQTNNDPTINNPCMTNLSKTVYVVSAYDTCHHVSEESIYPGFIQALWVLMMSTHSPQNSVEPHTPETLAVMVHLIVKALPDTLRTQLSVCNDIARLSDMCTKEKQFIPITAVVGGMFGLNIQVIANKQSYTVGNPYYTHSAPGALYLTHRGWCVVKGQAVLSRPSWVPTDTFKEYLRLNDLTVTTVPADSYCGFHTALVLLDGSVYCTRTERAGLVKTTAAYIMSQTDASIQVYKDCNNIHRQQDLYDMLMTPNRWLSVDELHFILLASGKRSLCITKHSYPLYSDDHVYFHIDNNHFQPVVRNNR